MNAPNVAMSVERSVASRRERAVAVAEVLLMFVATHVALKAFKQFTAWGAWERAARLNFSPGLCFGSAALALLLIARRDLKVYGLQLPREPRKPRSGARLGAALMLYLVPLGLFLRYDPQPVHGLLTFFGFVAVVAVGEELFFRGYVQSRLNLAFGRHWQIRSIAFGPGLLIASVLFGFLHALNTVDYFHSHFAFDWRWAATTTITGLGFGLIREATGSLWPGVVVHGLLDVWITALAALTHRG